MQQPDSSPSQSRSIPYSPLTPLNTLDIYIPRPQPASSNPKYWVIYIHGGAWRDPLITSTSITPTLTHLFPTTTTSLPPILGVASLNYRLSPYPHHPSHPSSPHDPTRNAKHPAHIEDVLTAIAWLQQRYGFQENYILVGHSCGATLAFQAVSALWNARVEEETGSGEVALPVAVMGVEGIYDIRLLRDTHAEILSYQQFVEGAFGMEEEGWRKASPTEVKYGEVWKGKLAIIAHSKEDELVDWVQVDAMKGALEKSRTPERKDMILELKGKHHEIWEDGLEMARAINVALETLQDSRPRA